MPNPYTYNIAADFPGGAVIEGNLWREIVASAIDTGTNPLLDVARVGNALTVKFTTDLTTSCKTILDNDAAGPCGGLIAAHDNGASMGTSPATRMATGTYTGDGSTSLAVAGIGFKPRFVQIVMRATTGTAVTTIWTTKDIIDDHVDGMAIVEDDTIHKTRTNRIISLDDDGFTVDDGETDKDPNASGVLYNYLAMC